MCLFSSFCYFIFCLCRLNISFKMTFLLLLLMFGASSIHSKLDKFKSSGSTCKPCPKVDCSKKCPMIPIPDCMNECHCPEVDDSGGGNDDSCLDKIKEIESLKKQLELIQNEIDNMTNDKFDEEKKCKNCPKCSNDKDDSETDKPVVPQIIVPDDKPCPFVKPCECINEIHDKNEIKDCPKCECEQKPCECENNTNNESHKYLPPPCPSTITDCPVCEVNQPKCPECESCEFKDDSPRPFRLNTNYLPPLL